MVMVVCIAAVAICVIAAIVYLAVPQLPTLGSLSFALGVVLTSALNVVKIIMLERSVRVTIDMDNPDRGKNYIRLQYLLRYFITAAILVVAGFTPFISVWGAIAGIFTLQISILVVRTMKFDDEC